jgi:hypothetical protein
MVVVTPHGDPTLLIAYAVLSPNTSVESEAEEFLRQLTTSSPLPHYMSLTTIVPSYQ